MAGISCGLSPEKHGCAPAQTPHLLLPQTPGDRVAGTVCFRETSGRLALRPTKPQAKSRLLSPVKPLALPVLPVFLASNSAGQWSSLHLRTRTSPAVKFYNDSTCVTEICLKSHWIDQ